MLTDPVKTDSASRRRVSSRVGAARWSAVRHVHEHVALLVLAGPEVVVQREVWFQARYRIVRRGHPADALVDVAVYTHPGKVG